jgi:hypothetical protein
MGILKDTYDIGTDIVGRIAEYFRKRREERNVKTILSVMTPARTLRLSQIVTLSKIRDEDVLRILRDLQNMDKVIEIRVDEEPKGTLWRITK